MAEEDVDSRAVDRFISEEIDSVPHLEALLLFWNRRPRHWLADEMAAALYISLGETQDILNNLERRGLIAAESGGYVFDPSERWGALIQELDRVYRKELVRISRIIHSKASPSVREFARAFKLKKD